MNSSGKREQSPGVVPDGKRQQPQEPVTDVPKARYPKNVTGESMATFMRAMKECSSWEGVKTELAWEPIPLMDHQLSIAVYLALNVGETLPDWVHDPKNNAIGDLLKSEEDVIKARLADLIDFDDPESEREFLS